MLKAYTSGTNNPIDISGCILRIIGFLYMNFFCFICNLNIRIHIKQPERNVDTFDLIDMIFFSEHLRQIFSSFQMRIISFFGRFLVQLERDDIIRLKIPGKLPLDRYFIITERAGRGSCCFICHNFTTAGLAGIDTHTICLIFLPLAAAQGEPVFFCRFLFGCCFSFWFLCTLKFFNRHFRITIQALHMLGF